MVEDRVLGPVVLKNPIRSFIEPKSRIVKRIVKYVERGMKVIDVGSGPGFYTEELLKIVGANGMVVAVDPNEKSIRELSKLPYHNLQAYVGSATKFNFPNSTFDFAFANLLLCCVFDYQGALNEIVRVLKPSAKAYLSVSRSFMNVKPGINVNEWKAILGKFIVLESGKGITERWAIVQKPE